jgi:nitroimidazol reductase NimA-like FMN-containing flavoprotein (pyridoxamine 5'-phosphate oxidase superfamily)
VTLTRRLEQLSLEQCKERLESTPIGRVVFTYGGLPRVLPVAFVVDDDSIVVRTASGSKLANAGDDGVLTFQADSIHETTRTGWSVVVTGHASLETDPAAQRRIAERLVPWAPGIKDAYVRIPMTMVTGRRIEVL